MKKRKFLPILLCGAMLLTACGGEDVTTQTTTQATTTAQQQTPAEPTVYTKKYDLNADADVKVTGRSAPLAKGIALDHSASTMEFTFCGNGSVTLEGTASQAIYFTVYVDGVRQEKRVKFTAAIKKCTLVSNLETGTHTVKIVRQTEEKYGAFTANTLTISGTEESQLEKAPQMCDLYIEFVGDSITCGSGALCKYLPASDPLTHASMQKHKCLGEGSEPTIEEDASYSYAYLCAQALGADCSLVSWSGIGVERTWGGASAMTMPTYYKYFAQKRLGNQVYDFANARKPDLVVLNLGTNDSMLVNNSAFATTMTEAEYKAAVKEMIAVVRECWNDPDLPIVWATGLMGSALSNWAASAIAELDDDNIYQFTGMTEGRQGHNGHPTLQQQKVGANQLTSYLKQNVLK